MAKEYIKLVDAIETIRENGVYGEGHSDEERENDVISMLEALPAADVAPVVRCKDCKHFYDTDINPHHVCKRGGSQVWDVEFMADDFCSYGERRADNG